MKDHLWIWTDLVRIWALFVSVLFLLMRWDGWFVLMLVGDMDCMWFWVSVMWCGLLVMIWICVCWIRFVRVCGWEFWLYVLTLWVLFCDDSLWFCLQFWYLIFPSFWSVILIPFIKFQIFILGNKFNLIKSDMNGIEWWFIVLGRVLLKKERRNNWLVIWLVIVAFEKEEIVFIGPRTIFFGPIGHNLIKIKW